MTCGIYSIECLPTGKKYIGSSVSIEDRWKQHLYALRRKEHHSNHLQRAYTRYGEGAFVFAVLEKVKRKDLIEREQHWLDLHRAWDRSNGFNMSPRADAPMASPASIAKMIESKSKFYASDAGVALREKLRQVNTGKTYSDETNAMKAWNKGPRGPMPDDQRAKVSASKKGKRLAMTAEQIAERNAKAWESRRANGNASKNGQDSISSDQWAERGKKIWATRRATVS